MKFSRWVFNIAGIYGVISIAPLYFMEQVIGGRIHQRSRIRCSFTDSSG